MFLRRFTDFVLRNRVQGMATAFLIAFIPIIGSISIVIAALITLRKGIFEGSLATIAATLPYVISYFASTPAPNQAMAAVGILGIIIASNVLTWVFAVVLRRFSNWNFTLEFAVFFGILVVIAVHLVYPDVQNWWGTQLNAYFKKTADAVAKLKVNDATTASTLSSVQAQAVATAKRFATGFIVVSILLNALLQLLIARWWQAVIFNPGGLRKELYKIRLGYVAGGLFILGMGLAYLGSGIALDAMPVLYAVFFVAGLSLLHSLISIRKNAWLWLILMYAGIIWIFPFSFMIVAVIALIDTAVDFRKRFYYER